MPLKSLKFYSDVRNFETFNENVSVDEYIQKWRAESKSKLMCKQ